MNKDNDSNRIVLPHSWRRPDVLLASLGINILGLALPVVILQIYDRIVPRKALETFVLLMIGMAVVIILDAVLRILRSFILAWMGAKFEHCEGVRAIGKILQGDTLQFEARSPGTYLEKIKNMEQIREFYSGQAMITLLDLPFVLVFTWLIWFIAGSMVLIPITLLGVYGLVSMMAASKLHMALQKRTDIDERRQNFMIETLRGIHTLKSSAIESLMLRRYERLQGQSAGCIHDIARINSINQGLASVLANIGTISFVGIGAIAVVDNNMTLGALAAGTMLTGRIIQPVLRLMGLWHQFQSVRIARHQVDEIFSLPAEAAYSEDKVPEEWGEIRVDNIHFRYPGEENKILRGISLTVQPREIVGITGANGAGKSTLLSMMMGILIPDEGGVAIGGHDVRRIPPGLLRGRIGFVPQKGVIYEGTILENLTLFRQGQAVFNAIELARILGLTDIIARLPNGLDTRIGSTAVDTLSEGLRQKIIIIRALVTKPDILFFDDANANFDLINDGRLLEMIGGFKGDLSMVIVTHRPSFLRICDRCFELTGGILQPYTPFNPAATQVNSARLSSA